ncbi:HNH endonuclease signature motif containing protein [Microbacterium arborescens]|uniref:HNH endonuclease signature motif containing protein n=1 Tax=Microbacterium arborescens TaxID=33883 RepID=UPI003C779E05
MSDTPSRTIPRPIKREVRQRCGFGCVLCGSAIYEYHHMVMWSEEHRHVAEEITLLCPSHHSEVTNGRLPASRVLQADADPFNKRADLSPGYALHYAGSEALVALGSNHFRAPGGRDLTVVRVLGQTLLGMRFEDGNYLLNFVGYDKEGRVAVRIDDNELSFRADSWDIEFVGTTLVVRDGPGEVFLDMTFQPPDGIIVHRFFFHRNGIGVDVRDGVVNVARGAIGLEGNFWDGATDGINLYETAMQKVAGFAISVDLSPDPRRTQPLPQYRPNTPGWLATVPLPRWRGN